MAKGRRKRSKEIEKNLNDALARLDSVTPEYQRRREEAQRREDSITNVYSKPKPDTNLMKKSGGSLKKKMSYGGMSDRFKNPKSASMMRYGGMKKAQDGTSVPNSLPERIINKSMNPSTNRVQQEEMEAKASVAKTDIRQKGRNKRSEERTDRQAYVQPEKTKRKEIKQTQQTARQISRDQRKVDKAMIKAGMNPKQTKKSGGSVKHGKKK